MTECIIIYRNPNSDHVGAIVDSDEPDRIYRFANTDEAIAFADVSPLLQAFPYQIIELDAP